MGDRKWNPHQSKLIVLEGPQIPVEQLSMGRGWPTAQRQGEDVTERVITQAKQAAQPEVAPQVAVATAPGGAGQLQALLGDDPEALLAAWRLAAERRRELAPSEALALAEETLRSLDASTD